MHAVALSARGLGRRLLQIGVVKQCSQQTGINRALRRQRAVAVVGPSTAGGTPCGIVDEHVTRPGVESEERLLCSCGRQIGHVGDAADVLRGAHALGMGEQQHVDVGDQRCALSARRQIAGAEVAHHGDAGLLRDDRRLAQLQGGSVWALWLVPERLPVAADKRDLLAGQPSGIDGLECGIGEGVAQREVEPTEFIYGARLRAERCEDALAQISRKGDVRMV